MIIKLKDRALLKVSGEDSESFLQSQLTNNITKIKHNEIQINAYCQHQGKIMALLWVFVKNGVFYISIPTEVKEIVLSKLNMFKLMSIINIEDLTSKINQYGLVDEKHHDSLKIKNNLFLHITEKSLIADSDFDYWEKACIDNCLPEIYSITSDQNTPQALNLDIDEFGLSFTKGCYPGQEVVARMHYLGKPKRRLFKFTSKFKVSVGDSIDVNGSSSLKSSGSVIRVSKIDTKYHFLGTFEIKHINDLIFLNNDTKKPLIISNG